MKAFESIETRAGLLVQKPTVCMAFIIVAVVLAFMPTFSNELMTAWDDQWQVTNHYTGAGFTWKNLQSIFTEVYYGQYSPLNQCMYTALYKIDGYNPLSYHIASLVLHLLNAYLVYLILGKILKDTTSLSAIRVAWITFLTTLFFAIHPLQVESVAWVSASKILLSTFFYLLATYTFIVFINTNRWSCYVLTLVFFTCAYGAKEQAVVFPLWLVLVCAFYKCDLKNRKIWIYLIPFFILSIFYGLVFIFNIASRNPALAINNMLSYTIWQRVVFSCYAIIEYIEKWYFPYRLLFLYYYPMGIGEALPTWLLPYPFILTVIIVTLKKYLKHWVISAGGIFFLIHILLVLHIIPLNRPNIVADRYIYFASIGLSFIAFYFLAAVYVRCRLIFRQMLGVFVILCVLILSFYTYNRTQVWYDSATLKKEIILLRKSSKTARMISTNY